MKKAYLAGPDVFHSDALERASRMLAFCREHGFEGVFPIDNEDDVVRDTPIDQAMAIQDGNWAKIDACDFLIANITPFRGPGVDDGTASEIGYARGTRKPVIPYILVHGTYAMRVPVDHRGLCIEHGMIVENFGLPCNLMLIRPHIIPVQHSFEDAVRYAATHLLD